MKPNHGQNPAPQTHASLSGLTVRQCWSFPKTSRRLWSLSLVLIGQAIAQLPGSSVLAATCTNMSREMGSNGESVVALQQTLNSNVRGTVAVDGAFGEETESALKSFQRANDLDPDGEVGPATCTALLRASNSRFTSQAISPGKSTSTTTSDGDLLKTTQAPPVKDSSSVAPPPPEVIVRSGSDNSSQDKRYHVIVPVRGNDNILGTVRSIRSDAYIEDNRLGRTVNAGNYGHRYDAESVSYDLRRLGLDARVVHRR